MTFGWNRHSDTLAIYHDVIHLGSLWNLSAMRLHTSYDLHVERRALNTLLAGQDASTPCLRLLGTYDVDFLADASKSGGFHLKYLV